MLGKIPYQCGGQTAFLDFCPWFVDPGEGEQVFTAPVLTVQLLQRPVGQQIHRRLKHVECVACSHRRNPKGIMLVAAVGIPDEVRADPSLIGVAGLAVRIHPDEHHIMIGVAFIKAAGLDAEIDQLIIDSSAVQVFDGMGGAAVDLRQKEHLFFRCFRSRGKGGRCRRKISHDGFNCLRKGHLFDLDEIVQRRIAADPTGKPAPFAVGDF